MEENIQDIEFVEVVEEPTTTYTYIKKEIPGYYFRPIEPLTKDNCDILGSTFEDFLNGKFVPLNEEQIAFAEQYPKATIKEIFDTELRQPLIHIRDIEEAKAEKLRQIDEYDNSNKVNDFIINSTIHTWFTPTERANYKQSVEAAELMKVDKLQFFIENQLFEVDTIKAKQMLAMIQLYADSCFIVTKQHKLAVEELTTIEDVDNYNYKVGYPNKLNFEL